jgi:hypothetical protein
MNQLLLLAGLVLVFYVMNEKKVFSGLSKTLSSGKNSTVLVLVFCGVILFMCMLKGNILEGMINVNAINLDNTSSINKCESLGLNYYKIKVHRSDNNTKDYPPVDMCLTRCEVDSLTQNDEQPPEPEPEVNNESHYTIQMNATQEDEKQDDKLPYNSKY